MTRRRVLVACEYSGAVREAIRDNGHEAVSVDLLPSDRPGPHIVGDALEAARGEGWDAVIGFPPCTHLSASGARWWPEKRADGRQAAAVAFFLALWELDVPMLALENPVGLMSSVLRKPDQIIQPWQFGHGETKATCLWLRGLPKLVPTDIVPGREARIHRMSQSPERAKLRSLTYPGVARAMADQWFPPLR